MDLTSVFVPISLSALLLAWLWYDLMVVLVWRPAGGESVTITSFIRSFTSNYPAFGFLTGLFLGLLLGHLYL